MRPRTADPVIDCATARPAGPLRGLIDAYEGSWLDGLTPGTHQGLPSGYLTLIIGLGHPLDIVKMPSAAQSPGSFTAFVGGLHATPATVRYGTTMRCMSVKLSPLGARALLGMPAAELASTVVDLRDVLSDDATELVDRLGSAGTWPERFGILDDVLGRRPADAHPPKPPVARAWRRLADTAGEIRIDALAGEVGLGRRELGERFRSELGLSPKVAARVLRFDRAWRRLRAAPRSSLAELAAAFGYYDQAHMTNEWRELAGHAPASLLAAEELPNFQDARPA